jgi:hypothetical protein
MWFRDLKTSCQQFWRLERCQGIDTNDRPELREEEAL